MLIKRKRYICQVTHRIYTFFSSLFQKGNLKLGLKIIQQLREVIINDAGKIFFTKE